MTLTINDTRNNQKGILWESLEAGHVYIDKSGWYVMCISDENVLVNLSNGEFVEGYDLTYDTFIPVKAKLEVFG